MVTCMLICSKKKTKMHKPFGKEVRQDKWSIFVSWKDVACKVHHRNHVVRLTGRCFQNSSLALMMLCLQESIQTQERTKDPSFQCWAINILLYRYYSAKRLLWLAPFILRAQLDAVFQEIKMDGEILTCQNTSKKWIIGCLLPRKIVCQKKHKCIYKSVLAHFRRNYEFRENRLLKCRWLKKWV